MGPGGARVAPAPRRPIWPGRWLALAGGGGRARWPRVWRRAGAIGAAVPARAVDGAAARRHRALDRRARHRAGARAARSQPRPPVARRGGGRAAVRRRCPDGRARSLDAQDRARRLRQGDRRQRPAGLRARAQPRRRRLPAARRGARRGCSSPACRWTSAPRTASTTRPARGRSRSRPGEAAELRLDWSSPYCGERRGGRQVLVLDLPERGGRLRAPVRRAALPRCFSLETQPGRSSVLASGVFEYPRVSTPLDSPLNGLRVRVIAPPAAAPVRAGGELTYHVMLSNPTKRAIALRPCPAYYEARFSQATPGADDAVNDGQLRRMNCTPVRAIAAGGRRRFEMKVRVPAQPAARPAPQHPVGDAGARTGRQRADRGRVRGEDPLARTGCERARVRSWGSRLARPARSPAPNGNGASVALGGPRAMGGPQENVHMLDAFAVTPCRAVRQAPIHNG